MEVVIQTVATIVGGLEALDSPSFSGPLLGVVLDMAAALTCTIMR